MITEVHHALALMSHGSTTPVVFQQGPPVMVVLIRPEAVVKLEEAVRKLVDQYDQQLRRKLRSGEGPASPGYAR